MNSTLMRSVALLTALATALVVPALSLSPAAAEDYLYEDGVEISWTQGPVAVGSSATVTVSAPALAGPATVKINDDDFSTTNIDAVITPAAPSISLPLPTDSKGTTYFIVEVDETDGEAWGDAYFGLTVTGNSASVTASFGKKATVKAGAKAGNISGRTSTGNLPVEVQSRGLKGAWTTLGSTTSAADGSYTLTIPTYWVGKHELRVRVPDGDITDEAIAPGSGSVTVRRTQKLIGSTRSQLLYPPGTRWNPCQVINYRLNRSRMPKSGPGSVAWALRAITQETGLRFRFAGATSYVPNTRRAGKFPADTGIVVAWSTPKQVGQLAGSTLGLGGAWYSSDRGLYDGAVSIDATQRIPNGKTGARELMLHELGHVVGLGHANDDRLIMDPSLSRGGLKWYGRGDVVGLTKVGARGGCIGGGPTEQRVNARVVAEKPTYVVLP